jgi:hypothetical protein
MAGKSSAAPATTDREIVKAGHKSMQQGFGGTLDQLEQYLAEVRI